MEAYITTNLDLEADVYMCIVFFIIYMKQMFRPILLSCVLYICFILFSNRLIDEHSRDHYRELTKEQNLGFDEEHLKIIDTLNAKQRAAFEEILIMS